MNKSLKNLAFVLLFAGFSTPLYASAWSWSAWENEDEELNFRGTNPKNFDENSSDSGFNWWEDEDEELNFRKKMKK
ncbi:MAG: hypothetical protein IJ638_03685, partial [Alphaproteobacteria bacterium]|nr:hypothetical protein [Alphaproteobacteria bacterium]